MDEDQDHRLIDKSKLTDYVFLGSGSFGEVFTANWARSNTVKVQVAVKQFKDRVADNEAYTEIQNMQKLRHENIVTMYGIAIGPIQLVLELCEGGSLEKRLLAHKQKPGKWKPKLLVSTMLNYAKQICEGMGYLESQQCVHRDLATRNVVKIADFGLTRILNDGEIYYIQISSHGSPYRWYPPEAILDKKFSHKSDVWSYAVTLWEMFTYALVPWNAERANSPEEILAKIVTENVRLQQPKNADGDVYHLMFLCWQIEKEERPSFAQIRTILSAKKFAVGKYRIPKINRKKDNNSNIKEGDEITILYEKTSKTRLNQKEEKFFGQVTRTRDFVEVYKNNVSIEHEHVPMIFPELSVTSSRNKDDKNIGKVNIEVLATGRTSLHVKLDNRSIIMYTQPDDLRVLQDKEVDCCIACPSDAVVQDLNARFPTIEWITWIEKFVNDLKRLHIDDNKIHLIKNGIKKKMKIRGLDYKIYKTDHGYIIRGPISKIVYLIIQELTEETKKQVSGLGPFNMAFFIIYPKTDPSEVKTAFELAKAHKTFLMFAGVRTYNEEETRTDETGEENFMKALVSLGLPEDALFILKPNESRQNDFLPIQKTPKHPFFVKHIACLKGGSNI